jgi:hypothetical protein
VLLSSDALLFVSFDADNDGRTSAADLDAGVLREWARADRNQDGVLTPLEFSDWARSALGGPQLPPYRLNFDRNVDNSITRAEFADELRARFDEYDANHDGAVTRAEMLRPGPQARPQMTRDGPRGEGGRSGEHRPNGEGDGPNSQGGGTGDGRPPL